MTATVTAGLHEQILQRAHHYHMERQAWQDEIIRLRVLIIVRRFELDIALERLAGTYQTWEPTDA